ncbi:MAG: DUF1570 domain-containing protein [Planctomycetota bacterium]|jgi:hypothetical protein
MVLLRAMGNLRPLTCAVALLTTSALSLAADVVVKKDGTHVKGKVRQQGSRVIVTTRTGRLQIERSDIRGIIRPSMPLAARFKLDPTPKSLLILASRAGMAMDIDRAKALLEPRPGIADKYEAAEALLSNLRLTPEHTRQLVQRNIEGFRNKFGDRATVHDGRHYVVLTTLGPVWAQRIAFWMDGIFIEYQKRLVFDEKVTDRFVVKILSSEAEHLANGGQSNPRGYFSSQRREILLFLHTEHRLRQWLYHEGMHQFLNFYVPSPPTWFDEGLAQYFQSARPAPGMRPQGATNYIVGIKPRDTSAYLKRMCKNGNLVPLTRLLRMSYTEFHGGNELLHYSQAWAFTHLLLESGNKKLKEMWVEYFFALRDGLDMEQANERVFGRVNMSVLERALRDYIKRM